MLRQNGDARSYAVISETRTVSGDAFVCCVPMRDYLASIAAQPNVQARMFPNARWFQPHDLDLLPDAPVFTDALSALAWLEAQADD